MVTISQVIDRIAWDIKSTTSLKIATDLTDRGEGLGQWRSNDRVRFECVRRASCCRSHVGSCNLPTDLSAIVVQGRKKRPETDNRFRLCYLSGPTCSVARTSAFVSVWRSEKWKRINVAVDGHGRSLCTRPYVIEFKIVTRKIEPESLIVETNVLAVTNEVAFEFFFCPQKYFFWGGEWNMIEEIF